MSETRHTKARYLIVAAATLMSFLLYLDRFCVSFAVDYIRQDLGLTQSQMSWFISSFFWSYALAQVPSGWMSDRYGARIMLVIYILTWSLFTGLIGASTSFAMLVLTRLGCGLGQSGAYPTAASVVGRWIPIAARGTASSIVANGGRIGGALAPVLTAYLIVLFVPMGTPVELTDGDILLPSELIDRFESKDDAIVESVKLRLQEAGTDVALLPGSDGGVIADALNQLLEDPLLYNGEVMQNIKLPDEGMKVLKRLVTGDVNLETEEQRRFNRFVLEGVFGKEIRKFYGQGWRPILYIYGFAGVFVAAFFWVFFRNRPELHPWSNEAEHALILRGRESLVKDDGRKLEAAPILPLILSGNMWCCCVMQWGTNIGWLFLVTWLPRYLLDVHNVPIIDRGYMTMTPVLLGMIGMFLGGQLTDALAVRFGVKWGRRLPIFYSRLTAIVAYLGCIYLSTLPADHAWNSPWVFTGLFTVVAFSTDFGTASTWAFAQDIGGRQVGSVLGWGNMWGNLGAAVAPQIYNYFLGESPTLREWNMMFGICAASFALSAVCALIIDATKPVVPEE